MKIVCLGTKKTYDGRSYKVFCKIEVDKGNLSISGVEGPTKGGNCIGSCGQIETGMKASDFYSFDPGWDFMKITKFLEVWRRWHLNDMRAGCEHQRADNWGNDKVNQPCPVCGYKYGSAWLKEKLPEEILNYLEGLPECKSAYAWI